MYYVVLFKNDFQLSINCIWRSSLKGNVWNNHKGILNAPKKEKSQSKSLQINSKAIFRGACLSRSGPVSHWVCLSVWGSVCLRVTLLLKVKKVKKVKKSQKSKKSKKSKKCQKVKKVKKAQCKLLQIYKKLRLYGISCILVE